MIKVRQKVDGEKQLKISVQFKFWSKYGILVQLTIYSESITQQKTQTSPNERLLDCLSLPKNGFIVFTHIAERELEKRNNN